MILRFKKSFGCFFNIVQCIFSIVICILIANDSNRPNFYNYLWILPLTYGIYVFFLTASRPEIWDDIRFLIIAGLYFIRNSLTPLFMFIGDYRGVFTLLNLNNVNKAIAIMVFEAIVVLAYAAFATRKYPVQDNSYHFNYIKNDYDSLLLFVLIVFCVISVLLNPSFMLDFVSLFSGKNIRLTSINSSGAWYTLFVILFPITYTFFCVYIMKIVNGTFKNPFKTVLNIFLIIVPLFFMNNSDAFNIICSLCIALVSLYSNGMKKKTFIVLISVGVIAVVFFLFFMITELSIEMSRNTNMQNVSIDLQAYFPGVCNLAGLFNVGDKFSKLTTLFYDIYSTIPFRNTIFGLNENHSLTTVWGADNGTNSQILPCVGQLHYYFWVFAPLVECWLIKISYKTYQKMRQTKGVFLFVARCMCFIYFIITPVMYNCSILFSRFFITILPMYGFAKLVEKDRRA